MIGGLQFINMWALGLLALVPILVLLYFLKLKRPQIKVASTLLWQKVIEDMRVNSPFQRLKRSLLLLLQLILLLLLIFALARPWLKSRSGNRENIIVMLDVSASMQAKEDKGRTRLELARDKIQAQIDTLHHKSEMMILTFDSRANIACNFTNNRKRLTEVLKRVEPTETGTDIGAAMKIATSIGQTRKNLRIMIYSDGAFSDPGKIELPSRIEFVQVGTTRPNLAITQMSVRRSISNQKQIELFVSVNNFSDREMDGEMMVSLDDRKLDLKYFKIPANQNLSQVFQADMPGSGILKVKFNTDDALALDNHAVQIVQPPRERHILLVSHNPFYIARALRAVKNVDLVTITPKEYDDFAKEDFTTVIWSDVQNPKVAKANNIYLGCHPTLEGLSSDGVIRSPDIAEWNTTHPINRFIDYSNLVVGETLNITFPKDAQTLLRSSRHPIMAIIDQRDRSLVISGFSVFKSSWPFQVTMLYFLRNCLEYFDEQHLLVNNLNVPVGGVIHIAKQSKPPQIRTPDGRNREMARLAGGTYAFSDLNQTGIYEVKGGDDSDSTRYAVNLFDHRESKLIPNSNPIADETLVTNTTADTKISKEYFRELLIVVLIVLVIEWFVYHRRIFT